MPYTPSGGYYERKSIQPRGKKISYGFSARKVAAIKREDAKIAALRKKYGKQRGSDLAGSMGLGKQVAVLICFEGPDAEKLAEAVKRKLTYAINTPSSPGHHSAESLGICGLSDYQADPKFVALHDCVKHPLKY